MAVCVGGSSDLASAGIYRPRRPERSVLHRLVREHLETFLDLARRGEADVARVPAHVERTFRRYLACGVLAHGFARARCAACGHDFLVAFSCRTRGLCPSCDARRMAETAAHLTDHVLPRVPLRQWVLSVPKRVRWFLADRPGTVSPVLRIFLRAVEKKPLADGRTCLYLGPLELLGKLASLIPPPRQHRTRYHGVLAPHARLRSAVVASAGPGEALVAQLREAASRMGLEEETSLPQPESTRAERYAWAMLLARIYELLPLACPRCGQAMRLVGFVTEAATARRILAHVGEDAEPPALSPSRAPPAGEFCWDQGEAEDVDQRTAASDAEC